jgi:hypothetical protein
MIQINTLAGIYSGSVLVARFTGSEHVGSLSLVQIGARPYSPVLGRFLSRDLGEPPANNVWRQTVFPILTFIVIGTAGQLLIADELFKVLRAIQVRDRSVASDLPVAERADRANPSHVAAPFAGVVTLSVAEGDVVEAGDTVATIEAMKMEASITAPKVGTVKRVEGGDLLVVLT